MRESEHRDFSKSVLVTTFVTFLGLIGSLSLVWLSPENSRALKAIGYLGATFAWLYIMKLASGGRISRGQIALAVGLCGVLAAVCAPATSNDVWSYAMYGRVVEAHHASPYLDLPSQFAADPFLAHVSSKWIDSPSMYGPVFSLVSAAVMGFAGTSLLGARLGFQLVCLALFFLGFYLLWVRRVSASRLAFYGLSPLALCLGVNDAHCDLWIGVGVLVCVLLIERVQRAGSATDLRGAAGVLGAGASVACVSLVKVTTLPAVVGASLWLWSSRTDVDSANEANSGVARTARSARLRLIGAFFATVVAALLIAAAFGGLRDHLHVLATATDRHSRFSLWAPLYGLSDSLHLSLTHNAIARVALVVVAGVGALLMWKWRNDRSAVLSTVAVLGAYQLLGSYTVGWYVLWTLPALSLVCERRFAQLLVAHASLITFLYFVF